MRALAVTLLCVAMPLHACLNDQVVASEEAEFRSRYASSEPAPAITLRGLIAAGMGLTGASIFGIGVGFWWHERRTRLRHA